MPHAGDELINPISGQRIVFRKTAQDTNGQLLEVASFFQPFPTMPPEHYHPSQEERFEVVSGALRVRRNGTEQSFKSGESFVIPAGTVHEMCNDGPEEAHVIWQTIPALKTETFFETIWGLARDGKTNKNGVPNLLRVALIAQEYEREFRLAQPPFAVQKIVFGILAPLARLLGYRGSYTYKKH